MLQDPLTLYKLIVLSMLDKVTFPLTNAQVSAFVLEKEYTSYMTLQQVISELTDAGLILLKNDHNRTYLNITEEGRDACRFFEDRIGESIRADIDEYLNNNEFTLRNEVSVTGDYYRSTSGEYEAHLQAKDRDITLVDITLSVPTEETAIAICDNWQQKNQDIYKYLVQNLFG